MKSKFLNGTLNEEIYVDQPPRFEIKGQEKKVYKLKRALYRFKQVPGVWYSKIECYLNQQGIQA